MPRIGRADIEEAERVVIAETKNMPFLDAVNTSFETRGIDPSDAADWIAEDAVDTLRLLGRDIMSHEQVIHMMMISGALGMLIGYDLGRLSFRADGPNGGDSDPS